MMETIKIKQKYVELYKEIYNSLEEISNKLLSNEGKKSTNLICCFAKSDVTTKQDSKNKKETQLAMSGPGGKRVR